MADCFLLHGFTGMPASWDPVRAQLPDTVRAHAEALPGHGGEIRAGACASFEDAALRLLERMDAIGMRRALVAGYSMGARLALAMLVLRPERFVGAVLIGVHPGLHTESERTARRASDARWVETLRTAGIESFADAWERQPLFASQATLPADLAARQRRIRRSHDPRQLALALERLGLAEMPDYRMRLADLQLPVTLVAGERDMKFIDLAREILSHLARGRLVVAPGSGHNVVLEQPRLVAACLAAAG